MNDLEDYQRPINPFKPNTQLYRLLEHFADHPMEWIAMPRLVETCNMGFPK